MKSRAHSDQIVERMEIHPESLYYHEHVARYRFAQQHLRPGLTLDIACGSGYGAWLLRETSHSSVAGVDVYFPAVRQARQDYSDQHILFIAASGTRLPFPNGCFQNILTLETLEHIEDDGGYLNELVRVLKPDGVCVLSTPNKQYALNQGIKNPYHVREYFLDDLRRLLTQSFAQVEVFYQGFRERYHAHVGEYAAQIQANKRNLSPVLRWGINGVYRPFKRLVPSRITNFLIQRILVIRYPQPALNDISISATPLRDTSVYVAVCRQPRRTVLGASTLF